jgi:ribonuclease P protein 1
LFLKEILRLKAKDKQIENKDKYLAEKHEKWSQMDCQKTGLFDNKGDLVYGLWHNSMVAKIFKYHCNKLFNHRLRNAALFGQKLVIDLDYDRYMRLSECRQLAKQLQLLYNYNRYQTREPFDLHFTNCNFQMPTMKEIPRFLTHYNLPKFMSKFYTESYLNLFPKERLVYLTPHAKESLKNYDFDDIYIIGGFVDKSCREPISLVKAKKEGIRSVRLPLDEHIIWGSGPKSLCLNHIIAILHDLRESGDWKKSLNDNVPKRKQKKTEEIEFEDMNRKLRHSRKSNRNFNSLANSVFQ